MFWNRSHTIDEEKWEQHLDRPDWYLKILPDYKRLNKRVKDEERRAELKEQVYSFFERHLITNTICLAESGPNEDADRKSIDTIVIHHTKNPPGMTRDRLNAMHLLRLYASHYIYPPKNAKHIRKQPIWSGHFHNGKQVFYSYHWLVREDGSIERLLNDDEIGWQAGNWEVNTRSVAICLDGDYQDVDPPAPMLKAVAKLIKKQYSQVNTDRIFGHGEINKKTECPGGNFVNGWKSALLNLF